MGKRIVFTGGSGKAGRSIIPFLVEKGYTLVNLDLNPVPTNSQNPVHTIKTDLTDCGQVFNALSSHFTPTEPLPPHNPACPDAVVHFAGYPEPVLVPDNETFRVNVLSCENVVEAACKLGVRKIILASSICAYGCGYAQGRRDWPYFPVDEDAPTEPTDVYGLSKVVCEKIAKSFAARFDVDIYCLRIGQIIVPSEYQEAMFSSYIQEPEKWGVHGWAYSDVRDIGQMVMRALEKDGLGFQAFNAVNDTVTNHEDPNELLKRLSPKVERKRKLRDRESPVSNNKIKLVLGFREAWDWREIREENTRPMEATL